MFMKLFLTLTLTSTLLFGSLIDDIQNDTSTLRHYYVPHILIASSLVTATVKGSDNRFGKTVWQSLDSLVMSGITTEALKNIFGRVRPRNTDVDIWFQDGHKSFPSGHVTAVASLVTPYILEYQEDSAWVHLLWLLPIQQMIGRYEDKAHYITDVSVGFLVGTVSGYYAHEFDTPLLLSWKDGPYAGISFDF
jgi:membrane-associated phospholipid phosphatase